MRNLIEQTKAFKALDSTHQLIYKKRSMMQQVERQFIVAKTIGLESFIKTHHPSPYNLEVIKELLKNEENRKE